MLCGSNRKISSSNSSSSPTLLASIFCRPHLLDHQRQATSLHALGKLRSLHGRSRSLDTKKLFAMSVLLLCLTRTMGFVTIGALNMQSVDFDSSSSSRRSWRNDPDERFYEKTMMVRATKGNRSTRYHAALRAVDCWSSLMERPRVAGAVAASNPGTHSVFSLFVFAVLCAMF